MTTVDVTAETRSRPIIYIGFLTAGLVALLLATAILVTYIAFDRQDSRLAKLELRDAQIAVDHQAIGSQLQEHARKIDRALVLANGSYGRGFRAGKRAAVLPRRLVGLEDFLARRFLVPRSVPEPLRAARVRVNEYRNAYSVVWPTVAIVATKRDALSVWLERAKARGAFLTRVGGRTVTRAFSPAGFVYAWSDRNTTYAVIAQPRADAMGRELVAAMR